MKCKKCGRKTNEPDGICAICKFDEDIDAVHGAGTYASLVGGVQKKDVGRPGKARKTAA